MNATQPKLPPSADRSRAIAAHVDALMTLKAALAIINTAVDEVDIDIKETWTGPETKFLREFLIREANHFQDRIGVLIRRILRAKIKNASDALQIMRLQLALYPAAPFDFDDSTRIIGLYNDFIAGRCKPIKDLPLTPPRR